MNKKSSSSTMVATKNKVLSCSTPERRQESPSREESDSLCDSDAGSPVPFLCTQDGAEGETDVVWNFYTPKSDNAPTSRLRNSTPLSRKVKKSLKPKLNEKVLPKRRPIKSTQKKTELFQDLIELNQNLHELIAKKSNIVPEKQQSGSEEDIFNDSGESPKSLKTNSRCLRRNLLSSKFGKPDTDTVLESDDSMNECLIKASQVVEDNIINAPTSAKRPCVQQRSTINLKPDLNFEIDHNSMDAIINSIRLESPVAKAKKCDSPHINNDSFDSVFGNLNESAFDRLTQMPVKNKSKLNRSRDFSDWTIQDLVVHDGSPPMKSFFGRHNSMPESPSVPEVNRPSTSGMVFGRYNSMPINDNNDKSDPGDSPIRCTPDEIKRKHQQAREKLLAKRLLPFTSTQTSQSLPTQGTQQTAPRKAQFQPRVASSAPVKLQNNQQSTIVPQIDAKLDSNGNSREKSSSNTVDVKLLIEKKRQEALMKLRKRQPHKMV